MIVGIGVDVVDVRRFYGAMARSGPGLSERLFTEAERTQPDGEGEKKVTLAARFAAKEAVAKTLGAPGGLRWHDCQILDDETGKPHLVLSGTVAEVAKTLGANHWHLSLSHDGDVAVAMVVAES